LNAGFNSECQYPYVVQRSAIPDYPALLEILNFSSIRHPLKTPFDTPRTALVLVASAHALPLHIRLCCTVLFPFFYIRGKF